MNYLDIREEQGTSYFIIRLYLNKEKKLYKVSLHMDFNYYFKIVLAYFLFPNLIPMLETTYLNILYHIISCCTYIHKLQFHLLT